MDFKCKKVSYSSEKFAQYDINRLKNSTRSVIPIRTYLCVKCNTWHLTSSALDNAVLIQDLIKLNLLLENKNEKALKQLSDLKAEIRKNYSKKGDDNKNVILLSKLKEECKKYKKKHALLQKRFHERSQEYSIFKTSVLKIIKTESEVLHG